MAFIAKGLRIFLIAPIEPPEDERPGKSIQHLSKKMVKDNGPKESTKCQSGEDDRINQCTRNVAHGRILEEVGVPVSPLQPNGQREWPAQPEQPFQRLLGGWFRYSFDR